MQPRAGDAPSVEQLRKLRAVVKAVAEHRKTDEPTAYVWLCAQVLGTAERRREGLTTGLTSEDCDRLIAWRLSAGAS